MVGFFHANSHLPFEHNQAQKAIRVTMVRDGHTTASMGKFALFYAD